MQRDIESRRGHTADTVLISLIYHYIYIHTRLSIRMNIAFKQRDARKNDGIMNIFIRIVRVNCQVLYSSRRAISIPATCHFQRAVTREHIHSGFVGATLNSKCIHTCALRIMRVIRLRRKLPKAKFIYIYIRISY